MKLIILLLITILLLINNNINCNDDNTCTSSNNCKTTIKDTILVTGANSGLGYGTAVLLAKRGWKKVYLSCRNDEKCQNAIKKILEENSDLKKAQFDYIILDANNLDTVTESINKLDKNIKFNSLILNAGGASSGGFFTHQINDKKVEKTQIINNIAHFYLVALLKNKNFLTNDVSIVYSGSEGARGIPKLGMKKPDLNLDVNNNDLKKAVSCSLYGYDECLNKNPDEIQLYTLSKLYGAAWMRKLSKILGDEALVVSVSPGMTSGTAAVEKVSFFQRIMFTVFFKIFSFLGHAHGVDTGALRYIDAAERNLDFVKTGKTYGSHMSTISGDLVDQVEYQAEYENDELSNIVWNEFTKITKIDIK